MLSQDNKVYTRSTFRVLRNIVYTDAHGSRNCNARQVQPVPGTSSFLAWLISFCTRCRPCLVLDSGKKSALICERAQKSTGMCTTGVTASDDARKWRSRWAQRSGHFPAFHLLH